MGVDDAVSACLKTSSPHLYIAYSGGIDSHVLLHACARLAKNFPNIQIQAIHIHHGLSPLADSWLAHCQQVCDALKIPLLTRYVEVEQGARLSTEERARAARYQAFDQLTQAPCRILLGQHQDDQLETVLLQLKRGAGPQGLAAMGLQRTDSSGRQFYRPFLQLSREDIVRYAGQHQLQWQEDESNNDLGYDRNFLRHQVIPQLRERWPGMAKAVSRSARLCAQQQLLLDEITDQHMARLCEQDDVLNLTGLADLSDGWQRQVLRRWLGKSGVPAPSEQQLSQLIHQFVVPPKQTGRQPQMKIGQYQLRRFQHRLYLLSSVKVVIPEQQVWQGQDEVKLADGHITVHFSQQSLAGGLRLSWQKQPNSLRISIGDNLAQSFKPAGAPHSKPLKKWFQQWQVPPWIRPAIPLIYIDDQLVMVVGYGVAEGYQQYHQGRYILSV